VKVARHLKEIRGKRSLRDVAEDAGINYGILSGIERGRTLPSPKQLDGIERAYGVPPHEWYPGEVLRVIEHPEREDE
jgi:transcriptional regulator with XRE-family HTH domain